MNYRILAVIAYLFATPSLACEPALLDKSEAQRADTRIKVKADCSYQNIDAAKPFEDESYWATITRSASPVRDRGNGKIAQRLVTSGFCSASEALLFLDCDTGESLIVLGKGTPPADFEVAGLIGDTVENIQPPYGPISIGPDTTATALFELAKKHNITTKAPSDYFRKVSKRDRYDITCGCKLFYPGSKVGKQ